MAAAAATAGEAPLHGGLPDGIVIWEILARLPPPKSLLRCRAWRRATSSRGFLLAHQPALPILYQHCFDDRLAVSQTLDIVPLDHRAGAAAAADQLRPVARLGSRDTDTDMGLEASCDGILLISTEGGAPYFFVCNPATRQYAPLPLLRGFRLGGMYPPHPPTGDYRLLVYPDPTVWRHERCPGTQDACHVYTVGSCHPPRHIGRPEAEEVIHGLVAVLFRGNLHWYVELQGDTSMIMVFDTTAELFREMRALAVPEFPDTADLFEMDGMLGIASFNDAAKTVGIWMTQDYDAEVWAFRYRVQLPVAEVTVGVGNRLYMNTVVFSRDDNDVLMLVRSGESLLQIDSGGKVVARFHKKFHGTTQFRLKQSLVQHSFFPAIEGYVVNTWPFIPPED